MEGIPGCHRVRKTHDSYAYIILPGVLILVQIIHRHERTEYVVHIALVESQLIADFRNAQRLLINKAIENVYCLLYAL